MQQYFLRAAFIGAAFALCAVGSASAQTAPSPAPKPTATPNPFSYGGYFRGYYFTRTNYPASKGPNQASFEPAVSLHAQGTFGNFWTVGGTYLYANPLNNCASPASHLTLPCGKHPLTNPPETNPDDTLPGYELSTLYEAYLQYKSPELYAKLGNQVINTPWAPASDSRVKPAAYQGGDVAYTLNANWTVEGMWMPRWEDRVQSDFVDSTLITQRGAYPDSGGISTTGIPAGSVRTNNGFYYGRVGYTGGPLTANLHYYGFDQIANAFWGDLKYTIAGYGKPFVALQGGYERDSGAAQAGKIDSQIVGIQAGYSPWKNVDLTVGADYIPIKTADITLPATASCGANHMISGTLFYWIPTGGTPNCVPATGTAGVKGAPATIYYGGWASPYTYSYATDPLFDTSISQGMIDRSSPGTGVKVAGTFYTAQRQLKIIVSQAWYAYGNATVGVAPTQEFNADATYFFNKVPAKGPYHGWSLRHRYADRTQQFAIPYGALPEFKYNRTQLEYDF
jgi:hypothetical protein